MYNNIVYATIEAITLNLKENILYIPPLVRKLDHSVVLQFLHFTLNSSFAFLPHCSKIKQMKNRRIAFGKCCWEKSTV